MAYIFISPRSKLNVWARTPPDDGRRLEAAVKQLRLVGIQVELILIEPHDAYLSLAPPVREQADEHFVLDDSPSLIDVIRTAVCEITEARGGVFLGFAIVHVAAREVRTSGCAKLGRHVAIRRVEDKALRLIAQGPIRFARLHVGFHAGDELPG